MLKNSIGKMMRIKSLVKDSSISDIEALDSLNEIIQNYSFLRRKIDNRDPELDLYSKEIKKLIEINKKAKSIEEKLNQLKSENQKMLDELMIHYNSI